MEAASALSLHSEGPNIIDILGIEAGGSEDSPPQEELLEVVIRAVARLSIGWPSEKQETFKKSKLDHRFLQARARPSRRSLPSITDLHTEVRVRHRGVETV